MHGGHWLTPGVLGVWKIGCVRVCVCVCVCSLRDGQREREPWGYSTGGSVPCVRVAVCVSVCVCVCVRGASDAFADWGSGERASSRLLHCRCAPVRWLLLRLCSSPASPSPSASVRFSSSFLCCFLFLSVGFRDVWISAWELIVFFSFCEWLV